MRCATIFPAKHLGLDAEIGSLETGKLADLLVLDRDPTQDIRNSDAVAYVMLNGRIFDANTMDQVGNHPDTVGSDAFGDGPDSLGIGDWWGVSQQFLQNHTRCICQQ